MVFTKCHGCFNDRILIFVKTEAITAVVITTMNKTALVSILCLIILSGCSHQQSSPDFYSEIRSARKLVLTEMRVTKMATVRDREFDEAQTLSDRTAAIINSLKVGKRVAVYSYDTYLQSYIDLGELTPADVVVDERNKTVSITLPEIRTELAGRDGTLREEHYRVTGMRSSITPEERARLKERMNASLRREVETGKFRAESEQSARRKAVDYFTSILADSGYDVVVSFKNSVLSGNYEREKKL